MSTLVLAVFVLAVVAWVGLAIGFLFVAIETSFPNIRRNIVILVWGYGADVVEKAPFVFWAVLEGVLSIFDPVEAQMAMPVRWRRGT